MHAFPVLESRIDPLPCRSPVMDRHEQPGPSGSISAKRPREPEDSCITEPAATRSRVEPVPGPRKGRIRAETSKGVVFYLQNDRGAGKACESHGRIRLKNAARGDAVRTALVVELGSKDMTLNMLVRTSRP